MDAQPVLNAGIDRLLAGCGPVPSSGSGSGSVPAVRQVLDLGGGTGGQAVRLALAGHHVTVVDPSPDALAALSRRADEAGVSQRLQGVQGEAENLSALVPDASIDLVLCHGVLEVVDDPDQALGALRAALRGTGRLSLVVAQRNAALLARVASGHLRAAQHLLHDPHGRWGSGDPLQRRFDHDAVVDLLQRNAFVLQETEGLRVFADLVPRVALSGEGGVTALLAELEAHASNAPAFLDIAAQLHVHAAPAPG